MSPKSDVYVRDRYNDVTTAELELLTPSFSWSVYLRALLPLGAARPDRVIVQSPEYLAQMDEIMAAAGLEVVSDYLHWQVSNRPNST